MQAMSAIALPNGNVGHFRRRPEKFQRILTYMEKVLFAAAFFVAYTIQAVTGFAGNIFAMPVGTHVMGLSSSVAVLNAMGFFACGMLAVLNFKYINWRELAKMTCGMLPFLALGIWLDTVLPLPVPASVYGLVLLLAALTTGFVKLEQVKETGTYLTGIFPLLFVPAAAGIMELWAEMGQLLLPILIAILPVTVLVMVAAGRTTQALTARNKKEEADHD